jgi:NAD(P)-dependent dehydrogenase (short-subunit alcohol dehydrogenase family)
MNWLAGKGAQSIVLIGRSAPSEEAGRKIDAVREKGVDVVTLRADVTDTRDVAKVVDVIEKGRYPLAGIIHSAGVLDDATIMLQTPEKFNKVLAPKVKGAWNLHQLTQHIELDFFVCFSSIASIVGWAGQSNYASANAFMDTLAFHRRALGKPALTINWGPWGGSGMAASLDARDIQRMKDAGMEALTPELGLAAMS